MIVTRTQTYAVCPSCQKDAGQVDHLLGRATETRWYCESCGCAYRLVFDGAGGVDISVAPGRKVKTVNVLQLPPHPTPVYFVVPGMRFDGPDAGGSDYSQDERNAFFYESHSCPTNWLKPEMVYVDGDSDPHGLLKFVTARDRDSLPPDEDYGPNAHDDALVALIESAMDKPKDGA